MTLATIFATVLNMSLAASIVIVIVCLARFVLRGAPKIYAYLLWALVLIRLLCPVLITSPFSLIPEQIGSGAILAEWEDDYIGDTYIYHDNRAEYDTAIEAGREPLSSGEGHYYVVTGGDGISAPETVENTVLPLLSLIWVAGMAAMMLRSIISYAKIRKQLRVSVSLRGNIYIADHIQAPFVIGFFRPGIYLPSTLESEERRYIIAHERHHIRRGDHIFKALGYLALSIHWFNPLAWLAFSLASKDMEMSCDEAVIGRLGEAFRADYSATLLNLATGRRFFSGTPLAFGEDDPAGRVRNLSKWKKPAVWVLVVCALLCAVLAVCLLTDPGEEFDWSVTRQEGAGCALGDLHFTAPEGMAVQGMEIEHDGNAWDYGTQFYVGETVVGGVALRYQDSESGLEPFSEGWERSIGVPEALEEGMAYFGGSSTYADYEITYFPDLPVNYDDTGNIIPDENGKIVTENEVTHYFFLNGDEVYDLWLYDNRLREEMYIELLETVHIKPPITAADTTVITLTNDPLPDGFFESRDKDGNIIFTDGTDTVGGVLCYLIPDGLYDPDEHMETLLYNMGIPDYIDTALYYRGGMTAAGGGWMAEFESAVPEKEESPVYRRHHFYPIADAVYDIWFDRTLLDYETTEDIRECINLPDEDSADHKDWNVGIIPERVSRTGATACFAYDGSVPGEAGAELTYGDFLSLDRLVDGKWIPCEELAGFDYYVGDSSYPVADGYGMVHEWQNRFGELPDGTYRMGKLLTLHHADKTTEEQMVYGYFTLPNDILTGPIPLEDLPETYSAEQAMLDGCFVMTDAIARENKELFQSFAASSWNGVPGMIRTVNWHYGEDSHWSVYDLHFDGTVYTLTTLENTYTFRYLKQFTGEKAWKDADHDAFDYYVLVNDDSVTFEDIMSGKLDMSDWENPAHWTVYADFIYQPKTPQLPTDLAKAVLEFEGKELVSTTDFDRLEKLWILFTDAEFLGYEPKTHSIGIGLNLILTTQDGKTVTIELDPDNDLCRMDGEFIFYGKADEPCYIEKLWYYLDIPAWPEVIYDHFENAFRLQGVG